jgi:hypothetical protein
LAKSLLPDHACAGVQERIGRAPSRVATCGFDPWKNGLEANRKNIERFALYSREQGLTKRRLTPEELFVAID